MTLFIYLCVWKRGGVCYFSHPDGGGHAILSSRNRGGGQHFFSYSEALSANPPSAEIYERSLTCIMKSVFVLSILHTSEILHGFDNSLHLLLLVPFGHVYRCLQLLGDHNWFTRLNFCDLSEQDCCHQLVMHENILVFREAILFQSECYHVNMHALKSRQDG